MMSMEIYLDQLYEALRKLHFPESVVVARMKIAQNRWLGIPCSDELLRAAKLPETEQDLTSSYKEKDHKNSGTYFMGGKL